ncbi:hypothetical protein FPQ18DRAFT_405665 [Pyronema domesticum]|uniref:Uncharacterized protein n=1 Tax=Pyronema omphalodes (strain CBS 100304) TaxID=1076935 RepID=U4L707_PYROM|nr:hypothetical protein FPQ18DRAFT_405665 [Pyronema domesticum]CCX13189.1 Protein of unknown function [Pyronema omphalodes CBS 100304]
MQFSTLLVAAFAASIVAIPSTLEKRNCPRTRSIPASIPLCEFFGLGKGNNESRRCERLIEEVAAQSCRCPINDIVFVPEYNSVACGNHKCWL